MKDMLSRIKRSADSRPNGHTMQRDFPGYAQSNRRFAREEPLWRNQTNAAIRIQNLKNESKSEEEQGKQTRGGLRSRVVQKLRTGKETSTVKKKERENVWHHSITSRD